MFGMSQSKEGLEREQNGASTKLLPWPRWLGWEGRYLQILKGLFCTAGIAQCLPANRRRASLGNVQRQEGARAITGPYDEEMGKEERRQADHGNPAVSVGFPFQ